MAQIYKKNLLIGMSRAKAGFTLIEVIMVTVIIAILAAIAVPNFMGWLPNMRLKAAARDLYSNMQKARMEAVKNNKNTAIIFDPSTNKYIVCYEWNNTNCVGTTRTIDLSTLKSGVEFGHGNAGVPATRECQGQDEHNQACAFPEDDVSYSPLNSSYYVVVFNSQGLGNAGYVYLDHKATNNSPTYAVGSLSSGLIKLLKWNGSDWK